GADVSLLKDAWGEPIKLAHSEKKIEHNTGWTQFDYHDLVSAGPDRKFAPEVEWSPSPPDGPAGRGARRNRLSQLGARRRVFNEWLFEWGAMPVGGPMGGMGRGARFAGGMAMPMGAAGGVGGGGALLGMPGGMPKDAAERKDEKSLSASSPEGGAPTRVREYF